MENVKIKMEKDKDKLFNVKRSFLEEERSDGKGETLILLIYVTVILIFTLYIITLLSFQY